MMTHVLKWCRADVESKRCKILLINCGSAIDGNRTSSYLTGNVKGAKEHHDLTSNSQIVEGVEGIRAVDDRTVQIELTSSYSYFLSTGNSSLLCYIPKRSL